VIINALQKHAPPVISVTGEISRKPKFHNYGNFDQIHIQCYDEAARGSLHYNFTRCTQNISEYNHMYLHFSIIDRHKRKKINSITKIVLLTSLCT